MTSRRGVTRSRPPVRRVRRKEARQNAHTLHQTPVPRSDEVNRVLHAGK